MIEVEVARDQYDVRGIQVKHRPTGAIVRWASDPESDFEFIKARAGEVLPSGELYNDYEVKVTGISLLVCERFRRKG